MSKKVEVGDDLNKGVEVMYSPEEEVIIVIKDGNPVAGLAIDYLKQLIEHLEQEGGKFDKPKGGVPETDLGDA